MESLARVMVEPPAEGLANPQSWFGSPGPFELEIGSGKGGFLLSRARANPDIRILGIEMKNKLYRYIADRLVRWQVDTARVMRTDASHLVICQLPPACVSILHLYHPDPWPKKRHHKRRLVTPEFARAVARILVPEGRWLLQSDHEGYFREMTSVIAGVSELVPVPWQDAAADPGPEWKGTNFEVKFSARGHPILRAAYRKPP